MKRSTLTRSRAALPIAAVPLMLSLAALSAAAAEWQWSLEVDSITVASPSVHPRAFLWIPADCQRVRAVIVGQNNMIEPGTLEHPFLRRELARLGVAEIFIAPTFNTWQSATNNDAVNDKFDALLKKFASQSGYRELEFAPIVPLGHSAMATFPWNFAAWNPRRTLAILSVHGDAPQTTLTGNGRPNADWAGRNIDGIPGLMVMGEYEWLEERIAPAVKFRAEHPESPLAVLAEPGNGHFNYSDELIRFLAMFIRKSMEQRLPANCPPDRVPLLKPVEPTKGWLVERWRLNRPRTVKPARFASYTGDPRDAFWCFDREMARATQDYFADQPGKLPQLIGFVQDGKIVPQTESHQQVNLQFEPLDDGVSFHLAATFLDSVDGGAKNTSRWTGLPAGSPLGHARGGGPIILSRISGPVTRINADTFRVQFDRLQSTTDRRNSDLWLLASQPGDAKYKSIVQQALLQLPSFTEGAEQHITFPEIPAARAGTRTITLQATSDSRRKVYYYIREGPAEIDGDVLRFTKVPPRAQFPLQVTVVAWQLGSAGEPKWKSADQVTRTFDLVK